MAHAAVNLERLGFKLLPCTVCATIFIYGVIERTNLGQGLADFR